MDRLEARVDRLAEVQAEQRTEIALLKQATRDVRIGLIVLIAIQVFQMFTPVVEAWLRGG